MTILEKYNADKKRPWLYTKELFWKCPRCNFETRETDVGMMHALDHLLELR